MADLADPYPGFASRYIATKAGRIFVRIGVIGCPVHILASTDYLTRPGEDAPPAV